MAMVVVAAGGWPIFHIVNVYMATKRTNLIDIFVSGGGRNLRPAGQPVDVRKRDKHPIDADNDNDADNSFRVCRPEST